MAQLLRSASLWYWAHALILFASLRLLGFLNLAGASDSITYILNGDLNYALSNIRTIGYPVFLYLVSKVSPDFERLPDFQFICYSISIFIFLVGLRSFGVSKIKSLIITLPIFYLNFAEIYIPLQLTESLAVSFAILTLGILLILVSKPRQPILWLLLGLGIFCTYQVRPAFLFLIPLIPVLGLSLLLLKRTSGARPKPSRFLIYLIATALVPLLAFSTLRLALVGHFGLVSFGGFNLIGITSQMLNEEMVEQLPEQDRALAQSIIEEREEHRAILKSRDPSFSDHALVINNVPVECTTPLPMDYKNWIVCYNYNIHLLSLPLAVDRRGYDGDVIAINRDLESLSRHIIAANPQLYFTWLSNAFADSFFWLPRIDGLVRYSSKVLAATITLNLALEVLIRMTSGFRLKRKIILFAGVVAFSAILIAAPISIPVLTAAFDFVFESSFLIALVYLLITSVTSIAWSIKKVKLVKPEALTASDLSENLYLVLITVGYFLAGILLVIAVEPPIPRYLMAVYTFFPGLFLVESYSILSRRFAQLRLTLNDYFSKARL